jgi:hypothetical protein
VSGRAGVELIVIERDGLVLLSSRMTPGFFTIGHDQNEAAGRYLQLLKQWGPMPMVGTQPGQAPAPARAGDLPRALYLGFAFDANFGDRWMYQVLARRMPVRFEHPSSLEDHWRRVAPRGHYELAMLGGGTLINQQPQFYQDALCANAAGLPLVCFGSGVGEVERWGDHRDAWVDLLRRFAFVGVRGPHSHRALTEAGLTNHVITGDPCLLDDLAIPADLLSAPIGLPLRVWLDLSFGGHENDVTLLFRYQLLTLLARLEGAGAITLNLYTSWNAYLPWIEDQVNSVLGGHRSIFVLDDHNRRQLGPGNVDLAIAYRLHAAAALLLAGVPTLVVRYEAKCLDFLAQLGLEDLMLTPDAPGAERLHALLTGDLAGFVTAAREWVVDGVTAAKHKAERHFGDLVAAIAATTGSA